MAQDSNSDMAPPAPRPAFLCHVAPFRDTSACKRRDTSLQQTLTADPAGSSLVQQKLPSRLIPDESASLSALWPSGPLTATSKSAQGRVGSAPASKRRLQVARVAKGGQVVLVALRCAATLGVFPVLGALAKLAGLLGAYTSCGATRLVLRVGGALALPVPGVQLLVPQALRNLLSPLVPPLLGLEAARLALRTAAPGTWRALRFWRRMLPIYLRYSVTKHSLRHLPPAERAREWEPRHEWGGERVYRLVLDLGGFYVKSAQVLASKSEFMPGPWVRRLQTLFDNVPPRPFAEVERSMERELQLTALPCSDIPAGGRLRLEDVFSRIQEEPLAAASIAQVHAAELAGVGYAGRAVVVKVQHLGMEGTMRCDLRNIGRVARFLRNQLPFDLTTVAEEIQSSIPLEFDFERELGAMGRISQVLRDNGCTRVTCPEPVPSLCTGRMLVMERLHGTPFTRVLERLRHLQSTAPASPPAPEGGLSSRSSSSNSVGSTSSSSGATDTTTTDTDASLAGPPHDAWEGQGQLAQAQGTSSSIGATDTTATATEAQFPGLRPNLDAWEGQGDLAQAQGAAMALLEAYGVMFFVGGEFHADPHPGNLLLLPGARLGLLDFGQSKVLDRKTQQQLASIILALASGDDAAIAHSLLSAGFSFGDQPSKGGAAAASPAAQPQPQSQPQSHTQSQSQAQSQSQSQSQAQSQESQAQSASMLARMAYVLFDTRPTEDATVSPLSADSILQSTPVTSFNKSLWLAVRSMLLLRGLCHSLQLDVSTAHMWRPLALRCLAPSPPPPASLDARLSFHSQRLQSQQRHRKEQDDSCLSSPQGTRARDVIKHGSRSSRYQQQQSLMVARPQHSRGFQHR